MSLLTPNIMNTLWYDSHVPGMLADQSEDSHLLALAGKRLGHRMVGSSLYQDRWMHINPQLTCKFNELIIVQVHNAV